MYLIFVHTRYWRYYDNRLDRLYTNCTLNYCAYMKNHCYERKTGKIREHKLRQISYSSWELKQSPYVVYTILYYQVIGGDYNLVVITSSRACWSAVFGCICCSIRRVRDFLSYPVDLGPDLTSGHFPQIKVPPHITSS